MHIPPWPAKYQNAPQFWQPCCRQAALVFGWQQENPVGAQSLSLRQQTWQLWQSYASPHALPVRKPQCWL